MNRLALVASAAAVLITGGCGGSAQESSSPVGATGPVTSLAPTTPASPPTQPTTVGTLTVTQQGTKPPSTLWYLRIEDMTAKSLLEKAFPSEPIAVTQTLPPGGYRVIAWHRPCTGTCPTSGDNGLGELGQVCGAQVDLAAGAQRQASAVLSPDGACTIKITK